MAKADTERPTVYVVKDSFIVEIDGDQVAYREGEPIEADDPQLKRVPEFFGPLVFPHPVKRRAVLTTPEVRAG